MGILSDITGAGAQKVFAPKDIENLTGQTYIVTGGHAGIGLGTTRDLALAGATVYMASRTQSKVDESIAKLVEQYPKLDGRLKWLQLDLQSLGATKKAAEEFLSKEQRLDGLVNNAGIMATPYRLTKDGIEEQFQVNHLSHFLFTLKLAPLMSKTGEMRGHPVRVVQLASFAHNFISWSPWRPRFKSLQDVNRKFDPFNYIRYSQAKLCAILFAKEFNKRMPEHVRSVSVHPGFVASDLYKDTFMKAFLGSFISIDEGSLTSIYAIGSPEVESKELWGSYFVPFGKVKIPTRYAQDPELAKEMWDLCEALVTERTGSINSTA